MKAVAKPVEPAASNAPRLENIRPLYLEALTLVERLHRDAAVSTTVKLRVIGRQQQLLRADFETAPGHEVLAAKLRDYRQLLRRHDVVILSDYGKGGLAHIATMIAAARRARKPVLVWRGDRE